MQLTELQKDGIGELLNIGMGRAASSLSEMTGDEIKLSVPQVNLFNPHQLDEVLDVGDSKMTSVNQSIEGAFLGNAILLFPEKRSLDLVRALSQDTVPLMDMTEMEEEALSEVGNIIINACVGSLSNILNDEIRSGLPIFRRDYFRNIFLDLQDDNGDQKLVLFIQIDFIMSQHDINGYVAILFGVDAMEAFLNKVDTFIQSLS